jgi:TolB-like protein
MAERNADVPQHKRIEFRIGIHVGDIIIADEDIFGDGVNIAVRLESLAEPGGILVSSNCYDHVRNKVDVGFDDIGAHALKNIADPVRAYRIRGSATVASAVDRDANNKPSIAVLPFDDMSGGEEQQYFGDGISDDIITELSRFRQLRVVARNSSFQFRGPNVDLGRVNRELGVLYVLEGSVRRLGNRIRITAQLVDASSGHHVWADRFDRPLEQLFDVQDEVVRTIVGTLVGRLQADRVNRSKSKPPISLVAYECALRGDALPVFDAASEAEARRLFERAIELDPEYAKPYALLAFALCREWYADMSGSDAALDRALKLAKRAVELDDSQEAKGMEYLKEAKVVDPFFAPKWYWAQVGRAHFVTHQYAEAIAAFTRVPSTSVWGLAYLAACYALTGDNERSKYYAAEVLRLMPEFSIQRYVPKELFKLPSDRKHLADGLRKAGLPECPSRLLHLPT